MSRAKKPPRVVWIVCGPDGYPWTVHDSRNEATGAIAFPPHVVHRYRLDEPKKKGAKR